MMFTAEASQFAMFPLSLAKFGSMAGVHAASVSLKISLNDSYAPSADEHKAADAEEGGSKAGSSRGLPAASARWCWLGLGRCDSRGGRRTTVTAGRPRAAWSGSLWT
eukprot:1492438-Rhodomonas_salina.2